jgi:hypothetical protein
MPKTKTDARKRQDAKPAAASQVPEWLDTPDDGYELGWWPQNADSLQSVTLTRAEYIALKLHLAKMRGFEVPSEAQHA